MLRIATANINGIRASRRRGFDDWLAGRGCDVVALQEVRAQADKIPDGSFGDYHVALDTGTLPGRNGVAVLTRHPPAAVRTWSGTAFMGVPAASDAPAEVVARAEVGAFTETGAFAEVGAFAEAVGPTGHVPDPPGRDAVTGGPLVTSSGDIARAPHQRPADDSNPAPSAPATAPSTQSTAPSASGMAPSMQSTAPSAPGRAPWAPDMALSAPGSALSAPGSAEPADRPDSSPALAPVASPDHVPLARGLGPFADQGRYLEVDLADVPVTIACLYLPKGGLPAHLQRPGRMREAPDGGARYARKMRFMAAFSRYLTRTRRAAAAAGREFLLMGDLNIAHTTQDLAAWRRNQKNDGFLPEEREWFGQQLSPRTLVDVVRSLHPDEDGPYSWWSWLGQSFAKDAGWRLDYHLATPHLARSAVRAEVDREFRGVRLSDHSPVVVDYDLR